jgi:hypothetical protein
VFPKAFWLAVICPLLKESGFSSTLTQSGDLFHFSTALTAKNKTPFHQQVIHYFCVKADLGVCPKIHDDDMRKQYAEAKESSRKVAAEDEFLR